jgi:hypothetical protein
MNSQTPILTLPLPDLKYKHAPLTPEQTAFLTKVRLLDCTVTPKLLDEALGLGLAAWFIENDGSMSLHRLPLNHLLVSNSGSTSPFKWLGSFTHDFPRGEHPLVYLPSSASSVYRSSESLLRTAGSRWVVQFIARPIVRQKKKTK